MTTTRDAFEAWYAKRRGAAMLSKSITGGYEWARTSEACEVWEAATAAERERCAMRATQLAEDAAIICAKGHQVNFNLAVGNAIRNGK